MASFLVTFHSLFLSGKGASTLLLYFNLLLSALGKQFLFPKTPSTVRKGLGYDDLSAGVQRFVVCERCHYVYGTADISNHPKYCTFVRYPAYPQERHREQCNAALYTEKSATTPKEVHAYHSLIASLQLLFARPGFESDINEWRSRNVPEDTLFDIYDGDMWFGIPDADDPNEPFVNHRRSLLLTLNVNWFRPFRNVQHSCGAIYLTVNNLPRIKRFKKENVILVGLMPGPKEAKPTT